ncbi:MAG: D-tyrosyl-tRNA(Tyr) deacylase [Verrucomicrobia bacterium]|nr:D-tyrosyl-tRNA(Tyr) deacylase [Verrucomicrobiota bacterium]
MKLVLQRVRRAGVLVNDESVAEIGPGAVVLLGVAKGDTQADIDYLARKVSQLRVYDDEEGKLNASIDAVEGSFLVVSQFTLYGDCRKGNRPSYIESAPPEEAKALFGQFVERLREMGHIVKTGIFRASMVVDIENDGPVTIIMESRGK